MAVGGRDGDIAKIFLKSKLMSFFLCLLCFVFIVF